MNILSIENLEKTLKDEPLFTDVTLGLEEGEKTGIVGRNGAGKSTFLRLIAGEIMPDEGKISIKKDTELVYVEQLQHFDEDTTLSGFLYLERSNRKIRLLQSYYDALQKETKKDSKAIRQESKERDKELKAMIRELEQTSLWFRLRRKWRHITGKDAQ